MSGIYNMNTAFDKALEADGVMNPYLALHYMEPAQFLSSKIEVDMKKLKYQNYIKDLLRPELKLYDYYRDRFDLETRVMNGTCGDGDIERFEGSPCELPGGQCHFSCRWLREGRCLAYD